MLVNIMTSDSENRSSWFKTRNVYILLVLLTVPIIFIYTMMNKSTVIRDRLDFMEDLMREIDLSNNSPRTNKNGQITLLAWTPFFSNWSWFSSETCPLIKRGRCHVTTNRSLARTADAVLFHWRNVNPNDLPFPKPKNQTWILINFESPMNTPTNIVSNLSWLIDATVSYRLNSDIYAPYGRIEPRQNGSTLDQVPPPLIETLSREKFQNKSLVTWLVSNCEASSKRHLYVQDMHQSVNVDIFGACTNRWTPLCNKQIHRDVCYASLAQKYKFYLSFENSLCQDYVTEKFYLPLIYGMVPVVLGGADYEKFAPKDSYINALDFESPKQLGDYLKVVGNNFKLYRKFLKWTKHYYVKPNYDLNESVCGACSFIINKRTRDASTVKKHPDLLKWYFQEAACWNWNTSKNHKPKF